MKRKMNNERLKIQTKQRAINAAGDFTPQPANLKPDTNRISQAIQGEKTMNKLSEAVVNKKLQSSKKLKSEKRYRRFQFAACRFGWLMLMMVAAAFPAIAQSIPYSNNKADQTLRSNGRVNPSTLGLEINIPLTSYPGRGINVPVSLSYSSKVWRMQNNGLQPRVNNPNCFSLLQAKYGEYSASGWTSSLGLAYVEYLGEENLYDEYGQPLSDSPEECGAPQQTQRNYIKRVLVHLPSGESHELRASDEPVIRYRSGNDPVDMTGTYYSVDSSKMKYVDDGGGTYRLYLPDGSTYDFAATKTALDQKFVRMGTLYKDVNGNQQTFNAPDANYPNGSWTDSIGRTIPVPVSPTAAPSAPTVESYQMPGISNPYKFYWKKLKGDTAAESGLTDFNQSLKYTGSYGGYNQPGHSDPLFQSAQNAYVYSTEVFNPIVLTAVELPNGQKYQFSYNIYGEIERIVYPTGGEEHLTLGEVKPVDPITADTLNARPYEQANRGVTQRAVYENANAAASTWTYSTGTEGVYFKATTTNPDGTRTERLLISADPCTGCQAGDYGFGFVLSGMPVEERTYSSTNQLLAKKLTSWTKTEFTVNGGNKNAEWHPRMTKEESVIYDPATGAALSSSTAYDYAGDLTQRDNPVNVSVTKQYGFTTSIGSLGDLQKSIETDYLSDANYLTANLKSLPVETRVKDAAGNVQAKTQTAYDEAGYGTGTKGQPTTNRSWTDMANNQYIETHAKYDSYGNQIQAIDAKGNVTQTEYSATYNYAYPTKVITPVPDPSGQNGSSSAFETSMTYDLTTGLPLTTTDANGQTTTMEYNDSLLRPTRVVPPSAGGQTVMEYTDTTGAMAVKTKTQIDGTNWAESTVYSDGLGRAVKSEKKDNAGNVFIETEYDSMGRVWKTSNPYRLGETKQWTQTNFDEAGRVKEVVTPDNAMVQMAYSVSTSGQVGLLKTITDQAGKKRSGITDAIGRMIRVVEDPGGQNLSTDYTFDVLGNLRETIQGEQYRYFLYDSLGRLLRAKQPEQDANSSLTMTDLITNNSSWSAAYVYDNNGNITSTTDARGITVAGTYDKLNRLTVRDYSDSTPDVNFYYDGTGLGSVPSNSKGKMTKVSSSVSETKYLTFDNLGRIKSSQQITNGQTYNFPDYSYDLAGDLISQTYPTGRIISSQIGTDGNLTSVSGQLSSTTKTYANNIGYTAASAVKQMQLGNGRWETAQFNSRLQVTQIGLGTSSTAQDLLKLDNDYGTTSNNGSLQTQQITTPTVGGSSGFTALQSYNYDALNRINSVTETISSAQTWKQTFSYDRYGNRRFDAANTTTLGSCPQAQCNPTIDTSNNRFTSGQGYSYDSAGNLTQDAEGKQFVYDAENRQKTFGTSGSNSNGGEYFYDGEGKRVRKVIGQIETIFVYNAVGQLISEYETSSATPVNTTLYLTQDQLGSPRIITDQSGNVLSRHDYTAFGEEVSSSQRVSALGYTADNIKQKYTGYERDLESGLDYAQARYYNSKHGRFTSVDPLTASATIKNPQTLNRYSYGLNSPYKFTDTLGLLPRSSSDGFCSAENSSCDSGDSRAPGEAEYEQRPKNTYDQMDAQRAANRGDMERMWDIINSNDSLSAYDGEGNELQNPYVTVEASNGIPINVNIRRMNKTITFQGADAESAIANVNVPCSGTTGEKVGCTFRSYTFRTPPPTVKNGNFFTKSVSFTAIITVTLPRWAGYDKASSEEKEKWDSFVSKVRTHEEGHVKIDTEGAYIIANAIPSSARTRAALFANENNNYKREVAKVDIENRNYDKIHYDVNH